MSAAVGRDDGPIPVELRTAGPATCCSRLIRMAATVVHTLWRIVVRVAGQWPNWEAFAAVARRAVLMPAAA